MASSAAQTTKATPLALAIAAYFEGPLDDEILRLRWDNEYLRKLLAEPPLARAATTSWV